VKQNNHVAAIEFFNKSLAEHRTKDVVEKLKQSEKAIAEAERLAYIDPEIAQQEKEKGNAFYKSGKLIGRIVIALSLPCKIVLIFTRASGNCSTILLLLF